MSGSFQTPVTGSPGPGSSGAWARRFALVVLVVWGALGILVVKVMTEGEDELARSNEAFHRGDLHGAVLHARAAALSSVPGAPHVGAAHARLQAIARGAENEGRVDVARLSWEASRQAALETDHPLSSRSAERELAERQLERLSQIEIRPPSEDPDDGLDDDEPVAAQDSGRGDQPVDVVSEAPDRSVRMRRASLIALSLLLGAASLGLFAVRGVNGAGRVSRSVLVASALLLLGAAGAWSLLLISG